MSFYIVNGGFLLISNRYSKKTNIFNQRETPAFPVQFSSKSKTSPSCQFIKRQASGVPGLGILGSSLEYFLFSPELTYPPSSTIKGRPFIFRFQ